MHNNDLNKKTLKYGFSILKCLLSFNVISSHCFNKRSSKNNIILFLTGDRRLHVPSFFILSFYFSHNTLISSNISKKIIRFQRLLIPYLGWPIIIFLICNALKHIKKFKRPCSLKILVFQLITGQGQELFHFWYLFDLMLTTFIFQSIITIFEENHLFILNMISILSYFLQYSKYSKKLYFYTRRVSGLARENEIIPFAVTGFTLNSMKLLNILEKYKFNSICFCLLIYVLIQDYEVFRKFFGVAYNGIKLNILSLCLVIIFSQFPSKRIKNKYLVTFLKIMTNYSAGTYYLHRVVQLFFKYIFSDIKNGTFCGILLI